MNRKAQNSSDGIEVKKIMSESPLYRAGVRKGDRICFVNGTSIHDELDFSFEAACDEFECHIQRRGKTRTVLVFREPGEFLGVSFGRTVVDRCKNRCIFCFIDQLPRGMRKNLYVKDEDYRYSFMDGNYITLTSFTAGTFQKIDQLGLSPLYVSVHATDPSVRKAMINNPKAGLIMEQLQTLADCGIQFHTQIVVCPGINDGTVLKKTLKDLLGFKDSLLSIAVVPVGLTKHRKKPLSPVTKSNAQSIIDLVNPISEKDQQASGARRLFLADEFFIKAGQSIPSNRYYEEYPQIENGVGLVRLLLQDWKECKKKLKSSLSKGDGKKSSFKRYLVLTAQSAAPFINKIIDECNQHLKQHRIDLAVVENIFFGPLVTVAGLVTAGDIISTIGKTKGDYTAVILPAVMFNYLGYTLDGFSAKRIAKIARKKVLVVDSVLALFSLLTER